MRGALHDYAVSASRITFLGTAMTMTDVSPIVTGLTGASQFASAGSSMTVRAMRKACINNGRFPAQPDGGTRRLSGGARMPAEAG